MKYTGKMPKTVFLALFCGLILAWAGISFSPAVAAEKGNAIDVRSRAPRVYSSIEQMALPRLPEGHLVRGRNNGTIYRIENGQKRPFTSFDILRTWLGQVEYVSDYVLDRTTLGTPMPLRDETLVRVRGQSAIYLIQNGLYRAFPNFDVFRRSGRIRQVVFEINQENLRYNQSGPGVPNWPEGKIVRSARGPIFNLGNGFKHFYPTLAIWHSWNLTYETVADRDIDIWLTGSRLGFKPGSVVKRSDLSTVHYVDGYGHFRAFTSWDVLTALGFTATDIREITLNDTRYNSETEAIRAQNGGLAVQARGDRTIYHLDRGQLRPFTSVNTFKTWHTPKYTVTVPRGWLDQFSLGGIMPFADNALIQARGEASIYLIENGQKRPITSWWAFLSLKRSPAQILIINPGELWLNPTGEPIYAPTPPPANGGPNIRVGIYENDDPIQVTADGGWQLRDGQNRIIKQLSAGDIVQVNRDYFVETPGTNYWISGPVRFTSYPDVILEILTYSDRPAWNPSLNDNKFRGTIETRRSDKTGQFWAINELPLDWYIQGIAEYSNSTPKDAVKAVATAARTYGQWHINHGGKHPENYFHVNNRTDQVYKGYGFESRATPIEGFVKETAGQIITYSGEAIVAPYFSQSDGRTRSWSEVWGGSYPWAVSVPVPENIGKAMKGHGVGLDASAAVYRASRGVNYVDILTYFYRGTRVEKKY